MTAHVKARDAHGCQACGECTVDGEHGAKHNCEHVPARGARRKQRQAVLEWYQELASEIPDGFTPLEAAVTVKCLDAAGEICLFNSKTAALNTWEALGMLMSAADDMQAALNSYANEDDE